jgi:hypothetical protein
MQLSENNSASQNSNAHCLGRPLQNDFAGGSFLSAPELQSIAEFFRRDNLGRYQ